MSTKLDANFIGKIVKLHDGCVGKVVDIHMKNIHFDNNLKLDQYYLVRVDISGRIHNLYYSNEEIVQVFNF